MQNFNECLSGAGLNAPDTQKNGVDTVTCHPVNSLSKFNAYIVAYFTDPVRVTTDFAWFFAKILLAFDIGLVIGILLSFVGVSHE